MSARPVQHIWFANAFSSLEITSSQVIGMGEATPTSRRNRPGEEAGYRLAASVRVAISNCNLACADVWAILLRTDLK